MYLRLFNLYILYTVRRLTCQQETEENCIYFILNGVLLRQKETLSMYAGVVSQRYARSSSYQHFP